LCHVYSLLYLHIKFEEEQRKTQFSKRINEDNYDISCVLG